MTVWTVAGIVVVSVMLILAAIGMVSAIRQTRSLAMLRIADVREEAQLIKERIHGEAINRLTALLNGVARNLRPSHQAEPLEGTAPPSWIDELYLFDADSELIIWRKGPAGEWVRWKGRADEPQDATSFAAAAIVHLVPPLLAAQFELRPLDMQFIYDVVNEQPCVIAHIVDRQGWHGDTVIGARLDLDEFQRAMVQPRIMDERLAVELALPARASEIRRAVAWNEDLGPVAPFLWIVPSKSFVDCQYGIVQRQTGLFIVATVLVVAALLTVIWAMLRVVHREIALSKLKQAFVADVSHELKTPLALIQLFGETLMSGRVLTEEKRQEYYEIITRESARLTNLINNILDFARIDAGKKQYRMQKTDVVQLVRETYEAYRLQLEHDGFEHQLVIAENVPEVYCDGDAVAQALINLINNAMKYTDQGDKFLGVDVSAETRRGRHGVLISVSDRGIGIRPEDRVHLFTDFYRANDERVRQRRGAGLGLALVKQIVDAHKGIVDVESRLVKGSTFRIFLPVNGDHVATEDHNDGQDIDRGR